MNCPFCGASLHTPIRFDVTQPMVPPETDGSWRIRSAILYGTVPKAYLTPAVDWWLTHSAEPCGRQIPLSWVVEGDDVVLRCVEGLSADDIVMEGLL